MRHPLAQIIPRDMVVVGWCSPFCPSPSVGDARMGYMDMTPVWPAKRRKKRESIGTELSAFSPGGEKEENSETNVVGRAPKECARPNGMSRPRG